MPTKIKSRRYKWGTLRLHGNMDDAAPPIYFQYEDDAPDYWRATPFQTANATHDWRRAFALVNGWLKGQN